MAYCLHWLPKLLRFSMLVACYSLKDQCSPLQVCLLDWGWAGGGKSDRLKNQSYQKLISLVIQCHGQASRRLSPLGPSISPFAIQKRRMDLNIFIGALWQLIEFKKKIKECSMTDTKTLLTLTNYRYQVSNLFPQKGNFMMKILQYCLMCPI